MSTRILLVDDHQVLLDGLRSVLDEQPGMDVVGVARDGREAVQSVRESKPDVVVLDLSMPGMNGIEASRQMTAASPRMKVICLSMHSEPRFVDAMLEAGASGYLLKDCALEELVRAIDTVKRDQVYLSPGIAGELVQAYRTSSIEPQDAAFSRLTDREQDVLSLIAEGLATKEISARLKISSKTVGTHREHVKSKLGIHSTAGLTKFAIQVGLTTAEV